MIKTYSLVCKKTLSKIWVGQGYGWCEMSTFYSDDQETMKRLGVFLAKHEGKKLMLICDDYKDDWFARCKEFEEDE